jgi:RNA polymerase sigma-70 factor, ECF subfamily
MVFQMQAAKNAFSSFSRWWFLSAGSSAKISEGGETREFARLLEEQIPSLRRYTRALTREASSGDDLVQHCLWRAVQKRPLFERGTNLRAWLFTIMHHQHASSMRGGLPVADGMGMLQTPSTQDAALLLRDLKQGFARLPQEQRQVLALVCVEAFSYDQTAAILGISLGTVRSRISRGREALRKVLQVEPSQSAAHGKAVSVDVDQGGMVTAK